MALQGALRGLAGLAWGIVCVGVLRGLDWLVGRAFLVPLSNWCAIVAFALARCCES